MSMWMVTEEDDDGMLWGEPIIGNSEREVIALADRNRTPPAGYVRVFYRCDMICILEMDVKI